MEKELVVVIDFGGQYNQLVARRVRECNVYCEIYSYKTDLNKIKAMNPKGIILTGGPASCYEPGAATCSEDLFHLGVPVLGLCYGAQLMTHVLGGKVERAAVREYGKTEVKVDRSSKLFSDVSENTICWMSHFDYISKLAPGFRAVATTANCPVAAAECVERGLYAIQFHPEVLHTVEGSKMLYNFVRNICGCCGDWKMDSFVEESIKAIREKVGNGKVLCALSGGVDSSVAAVLLSKAVGEQLTCVFVDHGLLRKNEGDEVEAVFGPNGNYDLHFIRVNAQERFYSKLAGVSEPEHKRKIIGEEFIRVFEEEAKKIIYAAREPLLEAAALIAGDQPFPGGKLTLADRLKSGIVNRFFYRFCIKSSPFYTTPACNGCGRCAKMCFTNCIVMREGKPHWEGHCTHCMACICGCPQHAIEYGKKSQGKPRYRCEEYTG